jgi:adenine-specific DNA-methyltransferase
MGTKQRLASQVAAIINDGPPGPLLDAFSGICAIGSAVVPTRQVWCNDVQLFASSVAKAFFGCQKSPIHFELAAELASEPYRLNRQKLEDRFAAALDSEHLALDSGSYRKIIQCERRIAEYITSISLQRERAKLSDSRRATPYRLFSITFAGGYLGLAQSVQVDSIRFAIDQLQSLRTIDRHQHRWLLLALCQAVSKVATTTGHFAQYMTIKPDTLRRFSCQRLRSVWVEWLKAIHEFAPLGTASWRARNRVFREDAVRLLRRLHKEGQKPAIIYADPPYTEDQYSRYYHVYETLLRYDYPDIAGAGRYRPDRFVSKFCLKAKVEAEMQKLVDASSRLGARLVLSYPADGLLPDAETTIRMIIKRHYGRAPSIARFSHNHSSLGGSKGYQQSAVWELVFATR